MGADQNGSVGDRKVVTMGADQNGSVGDRKVLVRIAAETGTSALVGGLIVAVFWAMAPPEDLAAGGAFDKLARQVGTSAVIIASTIVFAESLAALQRPLAVASGAFLATSAVYHSMRAIASTEAELAQCDVALVLGLCLVVGGIVTIAGIIFAHGFLGRWLQSITILSEEFCSFEVGEFAAGGGRRTPPPWYTSSKHRTHELLHHRGLAHTAGYEGIIGVWPPRIHQQCDVNYREIRRDQ
jgi:hypothetical protein